MAVGKIYRQLCWTCQKCTNENLCDFVKTLSPTKNILIDSKGYIIHCDNYVKDIVIENKNKKMKIKDKAALLGITPNMYSMYKLYLKKHHIKLSVEEYLEKRKKQKKERGIKICQKLKN